MVPRCLLLVVSLLGGCAEFGYGTAPKTVRSSSSTVEVTSGVHVELAQRGGRIDVRASHLCDVTTREEHVAGALAERFHPQAGLDAHRREKDRESAQSGPLTMGILRGSDDAGMQERSLGGEIHRGVTSPLFLGAVVGGAIETAMVATSRIEGKLSGELDRRSGVRRGVACGQQAFDGAVVALRMGAREVAVGRTDREGALSIDLAVALGPAACPDTATLVVAGEEAGEIDLRSLHADPGVPALEIAAAR